MPRCFFVSDLHGRGSRYEKLFAAVEKERPDAVFLGGDLLPHGLARPGEDLPPHDEFIREVLAAGFERVALRAGGPAPRVFLILGNDDPRFEEEAILAAESRGIWEYVHGRRIEWEGFEVYGYAFVPPTPFRLKDWERYDVSRFVDPGCYAPEEGWRTVEADERDLRFGTIREDLDRLAEGADLARAVFLMHTPPYGTALDRAALDGKAVDHAPLDVHIGSVAVRRFIEARRPLLTLHGHVHESARITGEWRERIGTTWSLTAAHDGPELALVRFDPERPETATRELV